MPSCNLITLTEAAARCGASRFAVARWLRFGIATPAGRLRLKATRRGGQWRIDPTDLEAFLDQLTARSLPAGAPPVADPNGTPEAVRRRAKAARDELRRMGV